MNFGSLLAAFKHVPQSPVQAKPQHESPLSLWEVDCGVKGWDIRHTYSVVAKDEGSARHRAKVEFKEWLASHTEISFAREAKLLKG